jgi:hypothetical protein
VWAYMLSADYPVALRSCSPVLSAVQPSLPPSLCACMPGRSRKAIRAAKPPGELKESPIRTAVHSELVAYFPRELSVVVVDYLPRRAEDRWKTPVGLREVPVHVERHRSRHWPQHYAEFHVARLPSRWTVLMPAHMLEAAVVLVSPAPAKGGKDVVAQLCVEHDGRHLLNGLYPDLSAPVRRALELARGREVNGSVALTWSVDLEQQSLSLTVDGRASDVVWTRAAQEAREEGPVALLARDCSVTVCVRWQHRPLVTMRLQDELDID